ncbi:uncharacterized protein LOC119582799 [Penaeus monodon]|uniref:uncharacterized protein LOC119582799 n=1 Tax=Penaeus monodon TaxID=6687 RepID=UPI0018A7285D|nr:uncharacterized protein LOC119582799 [Penaeus monodon]
MALELMKKIRSKKNASLRIFLIVLGFLGLLIWAIVISLLLHPSLQAFSDPASHPYDKQLHPCDVPLGPLSYTQPLINVGYILCTSVIIYSVMSKTFPSSYDLERVRKNVAWLVGLVFMGTSECVATFLYTSDSTGEDYKYTGNTITLSCALSFIWAIFIAATAWGLHQTFYTVMMLKMSRSGINKSFPKHATPYPAKDNRFAVHDSSHIQITPLVHGPPPIIIRSEASVLPQTHSPSDACTPARNLLQSQILPYPQTPLHTSQILQSTPMGHGSRMPSPGHLSTSPQIMSQALSPNMTLTTSSLPYGIHSPH